VNASPLIILSRVSPILLIHEMCKDMVIPAAVAKEINEGPSDDPAKIWLNGQGKKWIKETGPIDPLVAAWDLGAGESQVISWAYRNIGYEVILDDRAAR
ncbi:MAG: DUF3368 domain-containing protein, partial [Proteobacteria bacterium]|nr:DUF3368 domain-containing protein [Pseudomonadota bacterium]